ncbi:methionine aminopeptidase [Schizophyllum commune Tattone D]|nr:methionine aminopeptidase [Schizophyllum commune Loenen D]KAI5835043.1 methionine aminopeptidase [Schizophyllum commune Tattone D]
MSGIVKCQSSSCPNGNPPSRLECPTCHKLGITGSFFCGQECFKAGCEFPLRRWKNHKIVHDIAKLKLPTTNEASDANAYNPFPNYNFTGTLRPMYPLSPRRPVPDHIPRPDYAKDGVPTSEIRRSGGAPRILNAEEIEKMRTVSRLGREILEIGAAAVRPGITTDEIDEIVHNATIERNAYPSPLNYRNFPKSVCTSVNEIICHGIPDMRKLREGDIVNIDVSLYYDGMHGDLNATYPVGKIDEESEKLIRTTRQALDEAIKLCKPGVLFRDVGKVIEPIARQNGCSVVRTYTGHGINDLFHTAPNIPHYAKNKAVGTMKPGMVFTIEPMINLGGNWSEVHWPDNWTAATVDGKRSAQFEETLLITDSGVEVLTAPIPKSAQAEPEKPAEP